jgi:hypothetical protein
LLGLEQGETHNAASDAIFSVKLYQLFKQVLARPCTSACRFRLDSCSHDPLHSCVKSCVLSPCSLLTLPSRILDRECPGPNGQGAPDPAQRAAHGLLRRQVSLH